MGDARGVSKASERTSTSEYWTDETAHVNLIVGDGPGGPGGRGGPGLPSLPEEGPQSEDVVVVPLRGRRDLEAEILGASGPEMRSFLAGLPARVRQALVS